MQVICKDGEVGFDYVMPIYNWFFPVSNTLITRNFSSPLDVFSRFKQKPLHSLALYFHIPYCSSICTFCSFVRKKLKDENELDFYVKALIKEIEIKSSFPSISEIPVKAIFFGGGTPSILKPDHIIAIGNAIKKSFNLNHLAEFSFEFSSCDIDDDKLEAIRAIGVTHARFGIQTFNPLYRECFRLKSSIEQISLAASKLNKYFKYVSGDMLYGINGQSFEEFIFDLDQVINLGLRNIAFYPINDVVTQFRLHKHFQLLNKQPLSGMTKHFMNITLRHYLHEHGYLPHNGHEYVKVDKDELNKNPVLTTQYRFHYHEHVYGYAFQDVVGFGTNAISSFYDYTLINNPSIQQYIKDLLEGRINFMIGKHEPFIDEGRGLILRLPYHGYAEKQFINWNRLDGNLLKSLNELIDFGFIVETDDMYKLTFQGWQWYVNLFYYLSPLKEQKALDEYIKCQIQNRNIGDYNNHLLYLNN